MALASLLLMPLEPLYAAERKPNVVLILVDDFGYECVTANGGESYKTPVMDKLAATGVRFEKCHVTPLCTPTRVALMTGMNNRRNYTNFGHLDPSQKTFANVLKDTGYATCVVGKWQLGNGFNGPAHFGFDEYCLWQLSRRPGRYKNPGLECNGKPVDYVKNEYGPDIVNDYAIDFMTRNKDVPFFLYYPMMLTHNPYDATPDSPDYVESVSGKEMKPVGHFPDMVEYADKLIGKVISRLDELHIRDNTLILVVGDNGTGRDMPTKFKGRTVLGGKGKTTTWGTHVPAIANWSGHFASGGVNSDLIDVTDFFATICEATGANTPKELEIDGKSFLPQLRGEKGYPREWAYTWYNPSGGDKAEAEYVQDGQYKLYSDGRFYDIGVDQSETSPMVDGAADAEAMAAKAKLLEVLRKFEGPRPEYFVKQSKPFQGESGRNTDGKRMGRGLKSIGNKPAEPEQNDQDQ